MTEEITLRIDFSLLVIRSKFSCLVSFQFFPCFRGLFTTRIKEDQWQMCCHVSSIIQVVSENEKVRNIIVFLFEILHRIRDITNQLLKEHGQTTIWLLTSLQ